MSTPTFPQPKLPAGAYSSEFYRGEWIAWGEDSDSDGFTRLSCQILLPDGSWKYCSSCALDEKTIYADIDRYIDAKGKLAPDFVVVNHGSIVTLTGLTETCRAWIDENISPDRQCWGKGIAIEPRHLQPVIEGLCLAGFKGELQ